MFKDYYSILGISFDANEDEIKSAFREEAIKWHPDKNEDRDTTKRMQDINEAYLILGDPEAKNKYDKEYTNFKNKKTEKEKYDKYKKWRRRRRRKPSEKNKRESTTYEHDWYTVSDEDLSSWIQNAKRQSIELAKKSLREFREMSYSAAKAGVKGAAFQLASQLGCGVLMILLVLLYSLLFA